MGRGSYLATCQATGKRGYETRAQAKRARRNSHFQGVSVYTCNHCQLFHVGNWRGIKDREAHRNEREAAANKQNQTSQQ